MKRVTASRLRKLISRVHRRRILVVGDLILDSYIWGEVQRISPEAPVPVVDVTRENEALGGAANVAANILALGGDPVLLGVIGDDTSGRLFRSLLRRHRIVSSSLLVDKHRPTTRKTRIMAQSQQVVRVDREVREMFSLQLVGKVAAAAAKRLASCDGMLLSDYGKGMLGPELISELIALAQRRNLPVFVDPKVEHFRQYNGATLMTPNLLEMSGGVGQVLRNEDELREAGRKVVRDLDLAALLVTRGAEGMLLLERKKRAVAIPTVAQNVFDVTGAGDTVISTLALARAAGASFLEGAVLANHAAGVVVGKVGAATVTRTELRDRVR